ncbi:MAG TPA: carboxypeptidase regulatory-like domain-containing protein [Flavobacteriales bacterium]
MHRTRTTWQVLALALLALGWSSTPAAAQKLKQRMAERYEQELDYPRMALVYEDIIASGHGTSDDLRKLAWTYMQMGRNDKASTTYSKLLAEAQPSLQDMRSFADLQRAQGNYDAALVWYERILDQVPDDEMAKAYTSSKGFFDRLRRDSTLNKVRSLPINSSMADLGPTVMDDLLIFSSARGEGAGGRTVYKWDDEPFLNLYTALLKGGSASEAVVMRKEVNSRYHDGTASYDRNRKRLYFTRDNYYYGTVTKAKDGEMKLGIYYTDVTKGEFGQPEWSALTPFLHNDPEVNNGHPAVSAGGRVLWFVSDRPGGSGGTDIWYCELQGDEWGAPKNAGPQINTSGNEMYPFLSTDSVLYFTSNGRAGLGGYDIFMTRLTPSGPAKVFNLGYPVNSRANDGGLVLLADDSTGFFFSDRPGGQGSDDIYGCTVHPPMVRISGVVVEEGTGTPIVDPTLDLRDATGGLLETANLQMLEGGRFTMEVPYSARYKLNAARNGYKPGSVELDPTNDLENVVIELQKYDYGAEGVVMHGETMAPIAGAKVVLMGSDNKPIDETTTDMNGHYSFALKNDKDYRLAVEKDGFFRQSARITTKGKASTIIRTDFKLFPLEVDQVVRLDNIYYDLAKWNIRPDAAIELDKLVTTLLDNPTVTIELSSHTDCRGKDPYNLSLSEKRAKSAVEYVIKKGIAKERVFSKGYGETKPVETCVCEKCTDDQHQRNRRTEFKVLSK